MRNGSSITGARVGAAVLLLANGVSATRVTVGVAMVGRATYVDVGVDMRVLLNGDANNACGGAGVCSVLRSDDRVEDAVG